MRKVSAWSVISGLSRTAQHVYTSLLTVLEAILTSSIARTAGSIQAEGAANAIVVHILRQVSADSDPFASEDIKKQVKIPLTSVAGS